MKIFLVVFFLSVQLVRIDDLHLLQFLTKPALYIHILFTSLVDFFGKGFDYSIGSAQG